MRLPVPGRGGALLLAVGFSLACRVVNLFATLVIVRICVSALGIESYGVLSTIVSVTVFFAFGDLGLGLALMNRVAFAEGRGDRAEMRRAIGTTMALVAAAVSALLLVSLAVYGIVLWRGPDLCAGPTCLRPGAILAVVAISLATVPLSVPVRILLGLQRSIASQTWLTAGRLATIAGVWVASLVSADPTHFAIAMVVAPLLVALAGSVWFFGFAYPDLRPRVREVSRREAWTDLKAGSGLLLLNVLTFADLGFDPLIVIHFFGAAEAGTLDVLGKLFLYIPALVSVGLTPVWPALARAHAAGDHATTRRILRVSHLAIGALSLGGGAVLLVFLAPISRVWLGAALAVDPVIAWSFMIWGVCVSITSMQSIEMNARDVVAAQLPIGCAFIAGVLALKIGFSAAGYLPGVPLALALLYPARILAFHWLVTRRHRTG